MAPMRAGPGWEVWKEEAVETSPALPAGAAVFPQARAWHLCEGKEMGRLETQLRFPRFPVGEREASPAVPRAPAAERAGGRKGDGHPHTSHVFDAGSGLGQSAPLTPCCRRRRQYSRCYASCPRSGSSLGVESEPSAPPVSHGSCASLPGASVPRYDMNTFMFLLPQTVCDLWAAPGTQHSQLSPPTAPQVPFASPHLTHLW